jgi:hypothetical protein
MSLSQDIRAALVDQLVTAAGFPGQAQRAFDDQPFTPTVGVTWARITYIPNIEKPWDVAALVSQHRGLLQVTLHGESEVGTGALDALADAIRPVMKPGSDVFKNSVRVRIERFERARAVPDPGNSVWLDLPVTVYWTCTASSSSA